MFCLNAVVLECDLKGCGPASLPSHLTAACKHVCVFRMSVTALAACQSPTHEPEGTSCLSGVLDVLNKKGSVEPGHKIKDFKVTSDVRATTLKHRITACHQRGRCDFSKGRK